MMKRLQKAWPEFFDLLNRFVSRECIVIDLTEYDGEDENDDEDEENQNSNISVGMYFRCSIQIRWRLQNAAMQMLSIFLVKAVG